MQRHASSPRRTGPVAKQKGSAIAFYGVVLLLAGWAASATLYILYSDDALKLLAERLVSITRAYEGQISTLQAEVERLRSLKLIEQERVDRALSELARRQTAIETREAAITALGGKHTRLESIEAPQLRTSFDVAAMSATDVRLHNLSRAVASLEARQGATLDAMEAQIDARAERMRGVLSELGIERAGATAPASAPQGGPFLPVSRAPDDPLGQQILRIRAMKLAASALEQEIDAVPVRRPIEGAAEFSSGFGIRIDPFLRQPAMHTGIDFPGDTGDEVHAAAAGRVVQAERNGGYGLMVEIDHGNGLASRYAHLSAINVQQGQRVAPGEPIGRIGSTGRSTGSHLHFEVRIDGEPTDPQRFLRAGLRLRELSAAKLPR
jgi:murein DD-endopeptidase MepM/ murein hydrolase activator NlpD